MRIVRGESVGYSDYYFKYREDIAEHLKTFTKRDEEWRLKEAEKILALVNFIRPLEKEVFDVQSEL
jgi:hypothetical protein